MGNYELLKAAINDVIKANGRQEITGEVLNQVLLSMVNSLGAGYQCMGVATPSTNPGTPDQNVFYFATQAGTYTNFNAIVLQAGISVLIWNGDWASQTWFTIDSTPTNNSQNLIASGAVFNALKLDGGAYDVTAHNSGTTFASLSALLNSENLNTLIPTEIRHGGMSIKFVQSSDNKYMQYRLMSNSFNTTVANWQGVDDEPTAGSENFVKSGGVVKKCLIAEKYIGYYVDYVGNIATTSVQSYSISDYVKVSVGLTIVKAKPAGTNLVIGAFYDKDFKFISPLLAQSSTLQNIILSNDDIPANSVFFIANLNRDDGYVLYTSTSSINGLKELKRLSERIPNIDNSITSSSNNPVKSSAIYNADQKLNNKILGTQVSLEQYKFIKLVNGVPEVSSTSVSSYSVTPHLYIDGLKYYDSINLKPKGSSPYEYAAIYDKDFKPIGYLHAGDSSNIDYNLTQLESDIQALGLSSTAKYVRFTCDYTRYSDGKLPISSIQKVDDVMWWDNKDIFNYEKVLKMPQDVVKAMVETYSMGQVTAIYDNDGYPSLMFRIPKMSIGQFSEDLGNLSTPHPAYVVNGVTKDMVYISVFKTCEYNGHLVSWFGLTLSRSRNLAYLKTQIPLKGSGWHLETIYERSLLSLLTRAYNSPTPHCNNYWGMNRYAKYESVQMADGGLPGGGNQANGAQWINGTQPIEWSHNKTTHGIQDVCGGYHELIDLVKLVDGHIYLAPDNNYTGSESSWVDTGATIDCIDEHNVISNTYTYTGERFDDSFEDVVCTDGFDSIDLATRKKLVLLGISPRLSFTDTQALLGYTGYLQAKGSGTCYMAYGGAEEYSACGLGYYNMCYDLMSIDAHNNMGSRLCYIG